MAQLEKFRPHPGKETHHQEGLGKEDGIDLDGSQIFVVVNHGVVSRSNTLHTKHSPI